VEGEGDVEGGAAGSAGEGRAIALEGWMKKVEKRNTRREDLRGMVGKERKAMGWDGE
jgi:hypothetical protein